MEDNDYFDSLSDYEVFITNSKDNIFIENIFGKCTVSNDLIIQIVTYEEYEKIEKHSSNTFFTRANYLLELVYSNE